MPKPKTQSAAARKSGSAALRVALYLRFSTESQGNQSYSTIDAQRAYLTEWAREKGYTVATEFADEAKSGANLKRPGFRALLAAAEGRGFDAVLVTFMDRLGRGNAFDIAEWELGKFGVSVVTACEFYADDTGGYISKSARGMVNGIYPRLVRDWTERKMVGMLSEGYHCAGRAPFGYRAVDVEGVSVEAGKHPPKRLVAHEEEAEIIRECFRRAADGEGQAGVRAYLLDTTGQVWNYNRIRYLLASQVYRGVATWGRHQNPAAHLPLVDEELWQEAQAALVRTTEGGYRPPNAGDAHYYLRGRVFCSCGRRMTPYWSKGKTGATYRYYQCGGKKACACRGVGLVSADWLHRQTFVEIAAIARTPWRMRQVLEQSREYLPDVQEVNADLLRLRREEARLSRERDRFLAAIRVSPSSAIPTLTQQFAAAEKSLQAAQAAVREADALKQSARMPSVEESIGVFARIGELWAEATEAERLEIASLSVSDVRMVERERFRVAYRWDEMRDSRYGVRKITAKKGRFTDQPLNLSPSNPPQNSSVSPLPYYFLPPPSARKGGA